MINSIIHHIGIAVSDTLSGESFFDLLLVNYLGMEKEEVWESAAGWKGRGSRIYLYKNNSASISPSLQHLAFTARNRTEIDKFPDWAQQHGVKIIGGPKAYPEYGGDYYAVFFQGPDELKFELVHLTEKDGAKAL